jgi:hypothetical protein
MESAHMFIGFISILSVNVLPMFFEVFTEVANHRAFISALFHVKIPLILVVLTCRLRPIHFVAGKFEATSWIAGLSI